MFDPDNVHRASAEPSRRNPVPAVQIQRPSRVRWEELQVDGGQFEPALTSLAITDVRVGAHGFALVRREQLNSLLQVTSTKNLALVVPGHGDKGFDDLALKAKRVKGTVVVSDPQLKRKELKDVSIFSIGALKVVGSPEFAPQPSVEIAVLAAKANFDADARNWSNFAANARAEFRRLVVSCLAPEHHSRLEMYAFKKLSDSAHRVIVRVPQDAALEFLAKSAVGHSLTFQAVWRDEAHKEFLDSVFCVEWLGPKSLPDARAVLLRIAKHFGLQQNRTGFGVRVPIVEVAEARKILKPNDSRFNDSNRHLVGRIRYFVYGLPDGTSRAEVAKLLLDKLQLAALVGGPLRRGGHLVFPVAIDQEPNKDTFELSTGPVLLRPSPLSEKSVPKRTVVPKSKVRPQPPRESHPAAPTSACSSDSHRISALEQRLADLEASTQQRFVDQEARTKSLEGKMDAGFAQVLAKLNSLQPVTTTA